MGPIRGKKPCNGAYEERVKDTESYCIKWKSQPCHVAEKSDKLTSPAWTYLSSDAVWGLPTIAEYGIYSGGGYFMKLDVNSDVSVKIFTELIESDWFDDKTRAAILEFTTYNANSNLFAYAKFVAEFPEVGGFIPYLDIQVFRLYLHTGANGVFVMFLEITFVLVTVIATINMVYQMCTDIKAFVKSSWNYLDACALITSYVTIGMFIFKIGVIHKTIGMFHADKNAYVGFENLAMYDFVTNTSFAILVFLLSIRVSRILGYSGKIHEMADIIVKSANDLLGFLLVFAITTIAYVCWGTLLFGKEERKYKSYFKTYGTLTEAIVGKNRLLNILAKKPGYAELYYFTFVLVMLMTLATMAAAILNFSISYVKQESKKIAPTNIVEILLDRIAYVCSTLFSFHRNTGTRSHCREKY